MSNVAIEFDLIGKLYRPIDLDLRSASLSASVGRLWYQDRKFNNLAVLLNGTDGKGGRYGYHKYGYHRYGYNNYGHSDKA